MGLFGGNGEEGRRGTHRVPQKITGKQVRRIGDGMWETPRAKVVWESAGTQLAMAYIIRRQATVVQWVALLPLFEVCARETVYKGSIHNREAWWCQEGTEKKFGPP